jgi:WD40 repeat protein
VLNWVVTAAFRPDGKELAIADGEAIRLWDAQTGKMRHHLLDWDLESWLQYSADGKSLLVVTGPNRLRVYNTLTGQLASSLSQPKRPPGSERALSDPLVRMGDQGWFRHRDPNRGYLQGWSYLPGSVVLLPSGIVRACALLPRLELWDIGVGNVNTIRAGHETSVRALWFSDTGRLVTSAGWPPRFIEWDLSGRETRRGSLLHKIEQKPTESHVSHYPLSPNGKFLAAVLEDPSEGKVYNLVTGEERSFGEKERRAESYLMRFAGERGLLVMEDPAAGPSKSVQVVQLDSKKKWRDISITKRGTVAAALSLDLRFVAVMFDTSNFRLDKWEELEVEIYDTNSGRLASFRSFVRARHPGSILEFSPDGRYVLGSVGYNRMNELFLLDYRAGTVAWTIQTRGSVTGPAVFSPQGRMLAIPHEDGKGDNMISVWEVSTGRKRLELFTGVSVSNLEYDPTIRQHGTPLAFSPDGRLLASGHATGTALIWDLVATDRSLAPDRVDELWNDLQSHDARVAWQAMQALLRMPEQAIRQIRKQIPPADGRPLTLAAVARLIAQLDDDDLAVRDRANDTLMENRKAVEPALKKALAGKPAPEARRRLAHLLAPADGTQPLSHVVALRAVELLELIGSTEAKKLLGELAKGHSGSRLTLEASAGLTRLSKKGGKR